MSERRLDAARPEAERGVGDQVLGQAVGGVGPAPHQVERVAGVAAVAGDEPEEAGDPARIAPVAGFASDREHEVLLDALDVLAELHREAALLGTVAPLLADLVELVDRAVAGRVGLLDQLEAMVLADPVDGRADRLHVAALEAEVPAVEDRLVAEVERMEAALAVHRRRVLADGEERRLPALLGAIGEELVEHLADVLGRPDRVRGDHRVTADVGVGDQRLPVGGEEVALVAAQREVGERVRAVGADDPPRVARAPPPRAPRLRTSGRKTRYEQRDQPDDAERRASASEKKSANR